MRAGWEEGPANKKRKIQPEVEAPSLKRQASSSA